MIDKKEFPNLTNCQGCKKLKHRSKDEITNASDHYWKCTEKKMAGVIRLRRKICPHFERKSDGYLKDAKIEGGVMDD